MKKRAFLFFFLLAVSFFTLFFFQSISRQKVKILYFRNGKCRLVYNTDKLIEEAKKAFDGKIDVKIYNVSLYSSDPPDPPEVKALREKYNVWGVPTVIINGKEFRKSFTRENLFKMICNNFIVKPEVCK